MRRGRRESNATLKLFRDIPPDFAWRLRAYQFAISCLPRAGHAFVQTRSRIRVLVRELARRSALARSRDPDDSATRESPRYVCITPVVGRKREVQGEIHRLDSTPRINYEPSGYISASKRRECVCAWLYVPDMSRYSYVRMARIRERMKEFVLGRTKKFVFNFKTVEARRAMYYSRYNIIYINLFT